MFEQDHPTENAAENASLRLEPDGSAQNGARHTAPSLYRVWRSRDFSDVSGQAHVTQTLRNAVLMGQVGHAYLFTGPRGTGKTSTARILARAVNCLNPREGEPCNQCTACRSMLQNRCLDLVEIDAASNNSVEDVRDLREKVNFRPAEVSRKVYIIDEVHMLSTPAFNALLKTLEEPPAHVLFVLATTDAHKVPATITSRCQRIDFRAIAPQDITARMAYICGQEGIAASAAALELIAQQATGSLRDALSLLEQVRSYEGTAIDVAEVEQALGLARRETLAGLSASIVDGEIGAALILIGELAAAGADLRQYARQLVQYWRDLLLLRAGGVPALGRTPDAPMAALAPRLSERDITSVLTAFLQPDYSGRKSASAQWQLELAVAEACQHFNQTTVRQPERDAAAGAGARPPAPPQATRSPEAPPAPSLHGEGPARQESRAHDTERGLPRPDSATPVEGPLPQWEPVPRSETSDALSPRHSTDTRDPGQIWQEVQRLLAGSNKSRLQALLKNTQKYAPTGLDGDAFVLTFSPNAETLYREQVEAQQNRSAIEEALARVLGRAVSLRCVTINQHSPAPQEPAATPRDTFLEDAARRLRGVHMDHQQP